MVLFHFSILQLFADLVCYIKACTSYQLKGFIQIHHVRFATSYLYALASCAEIVVSLWDTLLYLSKGLLLVYVLLVIGAGPLHQRLFHCPQKRKFNKWSYHAKAHLYTPKLYEGYLLYLLYDTSICNAHNGGITYCISAHKGAITCCLIAKTATKLYGSSWVNGFHGVSLHNFLPSIIWCISLLIFLGTIYFNSPIASSILFHSQ